MKYQKKISKSFIKVWEDFYINYMTMFNILEPEYKRYKENKKKRLEKEMQAKKFAKNIDSEPLLDAQFSEGNIDPQSSNSVKNKFLEQFNLELKKVDYFYSQNLNKVIRPKIKEIKDQIRHANLINEFKMNADTFEIAIKETYKDIHLTKRFIETNLEIKDTLIKKYKKYFGIETFRNYSRKKMESNNQIILEDEKENEELDDDLEGTINEQINFKLSIGSYIETLKSEENELERIFEENFSFKYHSKTD